MPNRLANATSPYLLQHANNPVDWYPWGQEAINKARQENKPILLSIGYASCHWCHVMAHESFSDPETAKLMNELFINIKVDREERPDLDKIYQTTHYLLTQQPGGWPLNVFLAPDTLTPFYSGNYFPLKPRYELPSFKELIKTISDIYREQFQDILQQNQQLLKFLNTPPELTTKKISIDKKPFEKAEYDLKQSFDMEFGGFGRPPKFCYPSILEFLLRNKSAMAKTTLEHMALGGIYDHIEGGFFRYAVDKKWEIPHFEKMLYDNGQILLLFSLAYKQYHEPLFKRVIHDTAEWTIQKMQSPEGGFYSSMDADTEGHEGKFYLWNKFEIEEVLDEQEAQFADVYFGLHQPPNFDGFWHLHAADSLENIEQRFHVNEKKAYDLFLRVQQKLQAAREKRIHPAIDKKILTAWNALMIKGMLFAGDALQEARYTASAERALTFIHENGWKNKRLIACFNTDLKAYLDDYAFLLDALLAHIKLTGSSHYLEWARQIADVILDHFRDKKTGDFYFTADDHEQLIYRPKSHLDEAIPSGSGVAIRALLELGRLTEETRYLEAAEQGLRTAWGMLLENPSGHCSLLISLSDYLNM
jgi:uncharacterized protein YyaL (SSP411 family)